VGFPRQARDEQFPPPPPSSPGGTVFLRFEALSTEGASALLLASVAQSWAFGTSGNMWTRCAPSGTKSPLKSPFRSLLL